MNHRSYIALLGISLSFILFYGCSTTEPRSSVEQEGTVIAEIDGENVYLQELISYYERNNMENTYTDEDLREFLPFYIDYKLKLKYGEDQGLFEDEGIMEEYENYSKQAAFSYWLENEIKKELTDEFMERSGVEIKSSHVLIQLNENSSDAEEAEAREVLETAREQFIAGEKTMRELNSEYSTQIQGGSAGGDLPWLTAGVTVKSFEDALYSLEPGEISEPVRTQFGYHLIHMEEKRERTPARKVSHIFFRGSRNDLSPDELAENAYEALESGRPWNEVVSEFSQDGSSSTSGGDIGWVEYGSQYSGDFINTVLSADTSNGYTEPVQTNYGFHIIRIDSVRSYTSDEQRREELEAQLEELPRFNANRQQVLERLGEIGEFSDNDETVTEIEQFFADVSADSIAEITMPEDLAEATLFTFNGQSYTSGSFMDWLHESNPDRNPGNYGQDWLDMYEESILDSRVIPMTKDRFPEFDRETEGFLSGLVVFQVSEENIWGSEIADSTELQAYYEENKDDYRFDERHDFTLLASSSDSVLNAAVKMAQQGDSLSAISEQFDNLVASRDSLARPDDEIYSVLDSLEPGSVSDPFEYRNRNAILIYHSLLEPRRMTFDEAFHRVNSDYQPMREEKFMDRLREEYRVETYPERIMQPES